MSDSETVMKIAAEQAKWLIDEGHFLAAAEVLKSAFQLWIHLSSAPADEMPALR
jgi:hypothetical protein